MPDKIKYTVTTTSPEKTKMMAETIGVWVEKGTVISLAGDLGSGKTSFVQGLAKGLGVPSTYYITSPTFNIINEYPGRHRLFHIDIYRLTSMDELDDLGFFDIINGEGVVAIEWADKFPEHFLKEDISISIDMTDDTDRIFTIIISGQKNPDLIKNFDFK
ncbi:MAG: tRNA (adenosine(37)-N6)-threonylcarbamoyltransferase complex ATPase subunit type 1 TsaE [Proteobacteria bacterium]|nr:tRNA (adenosine(37)-N6)-threonylcarbamoyltransferase complex ATPase subunit type 1 TsaE [Pseudomonadota bacterium]